MMVHRPSGRPTAKPTIMPVEEELEAAGESVTMVTDASVTLKPPIPFADAWLVMLWTAFGREWNHPGLPETITEPEANLSNVTAYLANDIKISVF
ncbi:unnamed protein product [Sphagnum balticum]